MDKKIQSALISVFYKDGLDNIIRELHRLGVTIYSTGGTEAFIKSLDVPCIGVESLTTYPSILGGRVKTLHPAVFGGILGRRANESDIEEMREYHIPVIDLVIVDLYPFEETVASTSDDQAIIDKIDIGGPSMIRAAAKNHKDVVVLAAKKDYTDLEALLKEQQGTFTIDQRRDFASRAFEVVMHYDIAISGYFNPASVTAFGESTGGRTEQVLRYGENPHQKGLFYGDLDKIFDKLHGKELSYNNLVDVDAAAQLISELEDLTFAIIKHTNVCGISSRPVLLTAWKDALAGDPESAFGGVLVTNGVVDRATAEAIHEIFFEVLIAKGFEQDALEILQTRKNRILLVQKQPWKAGSQSKSLLNGTLVQGTDEGNYKEWNEVGGRHSDEAEKSDLIFANLVCKHLKSNAIALVKNKQLIGKGCGQTSRVDALRHAIDKARQFNFDLKGAVLASDAFFPFNDCVQIADEAGITAFIQPGGSVRDKDSIQYTVDHDLVMVMTGLRHFRH
jgi:phosphoribosylaminoimidazolecarboxamide formyltransferase/IMP cyclohydrolase